MIGGTLGGFFALLIGASAALFWFGRYRIVSANAEIQKYDVDSERRAVENFTGVRSDGLYPVRRGEGGQVQGWSGGDPDERPPSYDDVHGGPSR
ncbi:hypothetical protein L218DRAFT_261392 [Marasmius fiardii PR-910]|nr:hypothetical protein L218DRAFT_261392 [Marasmius fiardii PR-910]